MMKQLLLHLMGLSVFLKIPYCKTSLGFEGPSLQFQVFCSTLTIWCKLLENYVGMTGKAIKINKSDGPHTLRPRLHTYTNTGR